MGWQLQARNGFPGHFCFRFSFVLDALTQLCPHKLRVLSPASFLRCSGSKEAAGEWVLVTPARNPSPGEAKVGGFKTQPELHSKFQDRMGEILLGEEEGKVRGREKGNKQKCLLPHLARPQLGTLQLYSTCPRVFWGETLSPGQPQEASSPSDS